MIPRDISTKGNVYLAGSSGAVVLIPSQFLGVLGFMVRLMGLHRLLITSLGPGCHVGYPHAGWKGVWVIPAK
jgi:hypothetical protein